MVYPEKYKYALILLTEDNKQYDITDLVTALSWDEGEKELAARISFTAKNDKSSKGRLSTLAKPGCYIYLMYSYDGGKLTELVRSRIIEWNPSAKMSGDNLKIKSYDMLYDLQSSQDNIYFSKGTKTKSAVKQIFKRWKITLGNYTGANEKHGKIVYKSKKLGTALLDLLEEAKKKGGDRSFVRAVKDKVDILKYGDNDPVYHFGQTTNIISVSHKISTSGMVTRVTVIGEENKDGRRPVQATVDGQTKYGIRQKIYTRGKDESLKEAKKAAKDILNDDGKPDETITIKVPDVPVVRKGDMIHVSTTTATGYYFVVETSHDVDSMTMTLDLEKAEFKDDDDDEKKETKKKKKTYKVGDIVNFKGGTHYVSSYPGAKGYKVSAGKAKITIKNGSGKAHPWHLVTQNWNKSHVWGWVDDGTFE